MIDKEAREEATRLLVQLENGAVMGEGLSERWPKESEDVALLCVYDYVLSVLSPDSPSEAGDTRGPLTGEAAELVARCRLFLSTDLPYAWPLPGDAAPLRQRVWFLGMVVVVVALWLVNAGWLPPLGLVPVVAVLALIMTPLLRRKELTQFRTAGDFEVWPFLSFADCEAARQGAASNAR